MGETIYSLVRHKPDYPWQEVEEGISNYAQLGSGRIEYSENHSLVTWNSYGLFAKEAERIKAAGGKHIVVENGYMQRAAGYYAIGRNGINGTGMQIPDYRGPDRFEKLGLKIERWKRDGKYVLVCGQRGGGYNKLAMDNSWPQNILRELANITDRPILYRPHPGRARLPAIWPKKVTIVDNNTPLSMHLKDAYVTVVWTSNAATESLLAGVPVIYDGPTIACATAAVSGIEHVETPVYSANRHSCFWKLAWQQWNKEEIKSGEAFKHVFSL